MQDSTSSSAYQNFTIFLQKESGITLGTEKEYLVKSRLKNIMSENGIEKLEDLLTKINLGSNSNLKSSVINAMTTNETLWFRDVHPFEILKNIILPELVENNKINSLKIWSAACSTGQEPISISMALDDYKTKTGKHSLGYSTFASDLSSDALNVAKKGIYHELAIERGLSVQAKEMHFTEHEKGYWKVNDNMLKNITFDTVNLKSNLSRLGQFDIIFCRNVLIYFTNDLKKEILIKLHQQLKPSGYLFIGAGESMIDLKEYFELIHCKPGIVYRKI
ncbi:CheR family methyltransferase [Marinicellulosiphila megalodicopiae]|uniref:CheR family methyltransferase n=1 Tax=Marinicellulosiphila megalodicopiae TaxID=2724896 RepID=UPI003BAFCA9B